MGFLNTNDIYNILLNIFTNIKLYKSSFPLEIVKINPGPFLAQKDGKRPKSGEFFIVDTELSCNWEKDNC